MASGLCGLFSNTICFVSFAIILVILALRFFRSSINGYTPSSYSRLPHSAHKLTFANCKNGKIDGTWAFRNSRVRPSGLTFQASEIVFIE